MHPKPFEYTSLLAHHTLSDGRDRRSDPGIATASEARRPGPAGSRASPVVVGAAGTIEPMAASPPPHIGTLREKPLHASLKQWCAQDGDRFEVTVDGYVIDVVRDGLLIEVQTSGFSSMKRKLRDLLTAGHRVRVVHPITLQKTIVRLDAAGTVLSRRRSPKRGSVRDVFAELVSFPDLIAEPGLELQLVLTVEDEYRRHDPQKAWRRRGWVVTERRLISIEGTTTLHEPADLVGLLPEGLPQSFTTGDIAAAATCPLRVAQQMAYCLRHSGAAEAVGKRGNSIEYRLAV